MQDVTYTADEIASMFKISKHTVYELIKRGDLKAFKVGNKMRVEHVEVERYKQLKASTPISGSAAPTPFYQKSYTLKLAGSHDFLVEHLVKYAANESAGLAIQPSYIGSLEGLMMLYRASADIAAIHLLDPNSQEYNLPFIRQLFVHEPITVIRLASREQGLIVAKGNPKKIVSVEDFTRNDLSIVNRQKGAGTRFLLDSFLANKNISPISIRGYENEEWTHLGAASHVSRGSADVAFGIKYAARQLGLDFIPVTNEKFDLVLRWTEENKVALEHLLDLIHFTTFKDSVLELEGYDASEFGKIIYNFQ
ncbi:substrate-binding domain-containing protein [Mesobacillus maritimus]|uniref:Helix-turn-helix transcriptional regulator n=1 Tax=Mesobacillus maritimus TaxID=1643336 RepID=A0ABS7K413_9BACI|nr:helix-turn-helix transcriptional regulator [Mesobacillus maritimus]MBY0097003.1 helix-turn-helix transcriptional regulator [Mesobacillus maritimus]